MEKSIRNAHVVFHKFRPASRGAINNRLKAAREKKQKKEEMMEKRKTKAIATKRQDLELELLFPIKKRIRVTPKII